MIRSYSAECPMKPTTSRSALSALGGSTMAAAEWPATTSACSFTPLALATLRAPSSTSWNLWFSASLVFENLVDRGGEIRQLLHGNHVQHGAMQLGEIAGEFERLASAVRSVVGHGGAFEHVRPPASRRRSAAGTTVARSPSAPPRSQSPR